MGAVFYVAHNLFFYLLSPHFPPYSTFFFTLGFVLFCSFLWLTSLTSFSPPPGCRGKTRGAHSAGCDREEGVGTTDWGNGGEGAGSPGSHRGSAGRQWLHQWEARCPAGYKHARTHTSIHVALHRLGRLIQSYGCVNQSLIPKCNKSNWTATSHSGGAQSWSATCN